MISVPFRRYRRNLRGLAMGMGPLCCHTAEHQRNDDHFFTRGAVRLPKSSEISVVGRANPAMPALYPRSFSGLSLLGFALVTLPLLAGLVNMAFVIKRLAREERQGISMTMQVTRATRQLAHDIATLQRAAGQYFVLRDPALRSGMEAANRATIRELHTLQKLPFHDGSQQRLVGVISREEGALYRRLSARHSGGMKEFNKLLPDFNWLIRQAGTLTDSSNALVDAQDMAITRQANLVWASLLWQAAAVVLLSLCLAALFSWLLNRPVRQIDHAIRCLGEGDLDAQPSVRGPVDLVFLGQQIDWLRQRLREIDEQKLRFLRHVSHELKTPLASLREGVELLADGVGGKLSAKQREITHIMQSNARDLQQRIENLLNYSRAQRHLDPLVSSGVEISSLIGKVIQRNELGLRAKRLHVEYSGRECTLTADQGKLDTLFENLLINAVRFSPPGAAIRLDMHADKQAVEIRICDQGPGVADVDRPHLFKPFFQGMRQPAAASTGNGLGLAIAQEYAKLHGGEIRLCGTSESVGACFCVRLPLDADLPVRQNSRLHLPSSHSP